ncbi:MAG: hypothetical protein WBX11_01050 [Thiobacillaceae bacterium]|jgi:hypothetical protein
MTRVKAALIHLIISAILASTVIGLLLFGWYRMPYFWAVGGPLLLVLIVGIDVVLGPLMTLIIFNPAKSRRQLSVDLSVIALVQATALLYGLYAGYTSRLAYGVFVDNAFRLVKATEIEPQDLAKGKFPEYRELPLFGPKLVAVEKPADPRIRSDMNFYSAFGVGYQNLPEYFVPLNRSRDQISKAAIPRGSLELGNPKLAAEIDGLLKSARIDWSGIAVVPFDVKTRVYTAVVDLAHMVVIKVLPQSPFGVAGSQSRAK